MRFRRTLTFVTLATALVVGLPAWAQQTPDTPMPPPRIGPLRLESENFSKVAGHCQNGPCMTSSIDYLRVVTAENGQAAARLTEVLTGWALRMDQGKVAKNPQEKLEWWVEREWKIRQEISEPEDSPPWHDTTTLKVEYQSAHVVSLSFSKSGYYGGAHGHDSLAYANFRPASGERIFLIDIFKQGFAVPLNVLAERRFRELEGLSPQASLKESGFNFPNNRFQLNGNFAIGGDGLTFYYNAGEIGSNHGAGPTILRVHYADIQNLLRPDAGIP
jgi:hypothetical protein